LRVLQEREIEPLGAERTEQVDVRVIADQPRPPRTRGPGAVPGRSLLPVARDSDRRSAPARAHR
jgi:hypothetical protein